MAKGSVILTHLIDGDPQGIRRVTMKNKTCEMYVIPRSLFSEAKVCKAIDLKQPALYILLENINSFADEKPKAYIGQAEDVGQRIEQHFGGKNDFFQTVLVFVSTNHSINKADVQYLEYMAIKTAKESNRFDMSSNLQSGTFPHLTPDQLDVIDEFREYVWLLTSFAGCRIFIKPISQSSVKKQAEENERFCISWDNIKAYALFGQDEMVLLKGSELRKTTVASAKPEKREAMLNSMLKEGIIKDKGDRYVMLVDKAYPSPSTCAWVSTGTGLNGWDYWKNAKGQTLDFVFRKQDIES